MSRYAALTAADALSELHTQYYRQLLRIAAALVDNRASAEEVVQQAYVDVLRRWDTVRRAEDVPAYLRRAVVNGARDRLRRRRTRRLYIAPHAIPEAGPEESMLAHEEHRLVLAALDALPNRQREVLVLRYLDGLSEADTAATLGITVAATKSATHKGITALRAATANAARGEESR